MLITFQGEAKQQRWIEAVREAAKRLRNGQEKQILVNAVSFWTELLLVCDF